VWETHDFILLDQNDQALRDFDELHSSFFSSDGYFPRSLKGMADERMIVFLDVTAC